MKINVKHLGISPAEKVHSTVEEKMMALKPLRQIDEAKFRVTRDEEASPPFRVQAHLVTPGPDLFADARDHTLTAALSKVMKQLGRGIKHRAGRRLTKWKSRLAGRRGPELRTAGNGAQR